MSFQTCTIFFLLWNTKEDILQNAGNQNISGPIDFHSICLSIIWVSMGTKPVWLPIFFKIYNFVPKRKKYASLEWHEGE